MIATALGHIIAYLIWLIATPIGVIGYISNHLYACFYFGWDKANKHQEFMVALHEKRRKP